MIDSHYLVGVRSQQGSAAKPAKGIDTHTHPPPCQLNSYREKVYLVHLQTSDPSWPETYYINSKQRLHTTTQRTSSPQPQPQPQTNNTQFYTSSSPIQSNMSRPPSSTSDILLYFLALFLPPLSVFLKTGCDSNFLINIALSILGWLPGVIRKSSPCMYWSSRDQC